MPEAQPTPAATLQAGSFPQIDSSARGAILAWARLALAASTSNMPP